MAVPGREALRLEVREFRDLTRWRWVLTDAAGAFVADHEVRLDAAAWEYEAFRDLPGYLSWHAAPDRWAEDEARIVGEVGAWIGSAVFGAVGPALVRLARRRPVTVGVVAPGGAAELLTRPLELAHVTGRPLATQDVTLVMDVGDSASPASPVGERLRVLGLFSLPEGRKALNLRRERFALVRLLRGIAAAGRSADVRVLQYGVTRDRLRDVLEEAEGWDVIHISGHGRPGELLLETEAGQLDRVSAADLADLLDLARDRVKLVTVAACWSAAAAADQQRRLLDLPVPRDDDPAERSGNHPDPATAPGTLATELARRLGCAVLAMRYRVGDDFAMALTGKVYDLLARKGQPLPGAVGLALRELSGNTAFPVLSVASPALFGGLAADLRLAAPERAGPASYDTSRLKMAGWPAAPDRFAGRTGVMARASSALAAASGAAGVVLHGMPGGGKTACALELGYGHEEAFDRLVWYKAPDEGKAIDGALTDFALTLERYLNGFQMADMVASADRLAAFLPRLTALMERARVLVVIDNLESLLTSGGAWRDSRWGSVLTALCAHHGLGRVVVTSRRVPAPGVTGLAGLRVEPVDALSADESLLLTRELPNLTALKLGTVPGLERTVSRVLARNAIAMARGHPALLELAEGQAASPDHLLKLVQTGDQEWRKLGGVPQDFFAGATMPSSEDYLGVLAAWIGEVSEMLSPDERDLFWFLCCLEERDRDRAILTGIWPGLRTGLGRAGQPPDTAQELAAVVARGLVALREQDASYTVHPGIATAGRTHAGLAFRAAVDVAAAAYWDATYQRASGQANDGSTDTALLVRAGLAAVPYLMRQQQWTTAATLLENAFFREPTRANAAAMLPVIQQAARHEPYLAGVVATVLEVLDPTAAEATYRAYLDAAVAAGDHRAASVTAGRLVNLFRASGRLTEALDLADQQIRYTRQAGLGPWTRLAAQAWKLQILSAMGQASHVLAEVTRLRGDLDSGPTTPDPDPGPDETVPPWHAREVLLDTGRDAAGRLNRWADALDLNAAQLASMRDRRAPATYIARALLNDYGPLLRLGRTDEALALLLECRQVFDDAHDYEMLGNVLTALADVEDKRGHGDVAINLERDALRHHYLAGNVPGIAISYHNLGGYLGIHTRQPTPALASRLTSALIKALTRINDDDLSLHAAARDLRDLGSAATPPTDIAGLDRMLGDIPGTDLPRLIAALSPTPETAEATLRDLIAQAQNLAATPATDARG